jgi:oligoribonuclease NrnB/cAMP/cGMP phosphodiesterase (DHH superfamily)
MKNIHHLSHIDLDGYSCQLVMLHTPYTMHFYNANYGAEVKDQLELILENIDKNNQKDAMVLISDLNLSVDEAKWIDKEINKRNEQGANLTLLLLDHHGSGEDCATRFSWYYLDTSRCATKIVYDYAKEHFNLDAPEWMEKFVAIVNAVDLWKQEEVENFEFGKVLMRLINEARELNRVMFAKEDNEYKLTLLQKAVEFIGQKDGHIALDEKIYFMKKEFFKRDHNDTLDNLSTEYIVDLLGRHRNEMTIYYKGYKGFLSYGVGNTSIIGNGFLTKYPDYDFIVDVSYRGTMSLRANNQVSVAQISKEWCNGGGHPNAAGGRIQGFKEQYRYDKVKQQIEAIINQKESVAGKLEYKED